MWETGLRDPNNLSCLYEKKIENSKTLNKKSIGLLGKNKINKET
jgi:hypothetical protein